MINHCCAAVRFLTRVRVYRKISTHLDPLSIPQSGGNMSTRLGGIITKSLHDIIAMQGHQTKQNKKGGVLIIVIIYDNTG